MLSNSTIITRTINTLTALTTHGLKFRVELPDGKSFGNIEAAQVKKRKNKIYRPMGSVNAAIMPTLTDMQVGDIREIPIPSDFGTSEFQSAVCSRARDLWGKETYTTSSTKNAITVLRCV